VELDIDRSDRRDVVIVVVDVGDVNGDVNGDADGYAIA
jgi:hypothetical protein